MSISSDSKAFCVIPARAGSKRLPRKNFRPYRKGLSLCEIAARVAVSSGIFEYVVISSDSSEAESIALRNGCHFIRRDTESSSDLATATDVVQSLTTQFIEFGIASHDFVYYLQPTSPLRTEELLRESWKLLRSTQCAGLVTVSEAGSSPYKHLKLSGDGKLIAIFGDQTATANTQSLPLTFLATGDVFAFRWGIFQERGAFPLTDCLPLFVKESIDIDCYDDFIIDGLAKHPD